MFEQGSIGTPIIVGRTPVAMAFGEDAIWVTNKDSASVTRIDLDTTAKTTIPVPYPTAIAVGAGSVWVASTKVRSVFRIDPETYDMQVIEVGNSPAGIAVYAGAVWVTMQAPTLSVARPAPALSSPAPG